MNTAEIRKEIMRIVDELPESSLPQVLEYLKEFEASKYIKLNRNIDKIFRENDGLFKRLAE